jgi:hypothetical protein
MSFRDHIRSCNNYDPARVVPLTAGNARVGLLRRHNAEALRHFPDVFAASEEAVELVARGDVAAISRVIDAVVDALVDEGRVPKWRNQTFDAASRWARHPSFASTAPPFRFSGSALTACIPMAISRSATHYACGSAGGPRRRRTSSTTSSPAGSATGMESTRLAERGLGGSLDPEEPAQPRDLDQRSFLPHGD